MQAEALALLMSEVVSSSGSRSEEACKSCSAGSEYGSEAAARGRESGSCGSGSESASEAAAPGSDSAHLTYSISSALNALAYLSFEVSMAGSAVQVGREARSALAGTLPERLAGYLAQELPDPESSVSLGDVNQCWTAFFLLHRVGAVTETQLAQLLATLAGGVATLESVSAQGVRAHGSRGACEPCWAIAPKVAPRLAQ